MHNFIFSVLVTFGIVTGQLNLIAYRIMAAMWVLWKEQHYTPDLDAPAFLTMYALHSFPHEKGLYGFKCHDDRPYALIENLPSSSVLKNDYFWVFGNFNPESLSPIGGDVFLGLLPSLSICV